MLITEVEILKKVKWIYLQEIQVHPGRTKQLGSHLILDRQEKGLNLYLLGKPWTKKVKARNSCVCQDSTFNQLRQWLADKSSLKV